MADGQLVAFERDKTSDNTAKWNVYPSVDGMWTWMLLSFGSLLFWALEALRGQKHAQQKDKDIPW